MDKQKTEKIKILLAEFLWHNEMIKQNMPSTQNEWAKVTDQWKQTYVKDADKILKIIESKHWEHIYQIILAILYQ